MEKELNTGKSAMLLIKLREETKENKLRWHKIPLDMVALEDNYGIKGDIKQKKGNHYFTELPNDITCHLQEYDYRNYVWLDREGEVAVIHENDITITDLINKLKKIVKFYSNVQIMRGIDEYLEVPLDEKAYLIDADE